MVGRTVNRTASRTRPGRRGPLLVASVAAGVLLAGGGGVYYAGLASGDGGGSTSGSGSGGTAAQEAPPQSGGAGIAPGEPDPGGGSGGTVYRTEGPLPQGPSTAEVHRPEGRVTSAEVTRLARALGLGGTPRLMGEVWRVGPERDGSGARLDVAAQAPGSWTFTRHDGVPGGDDCLKGKACPPPGEALPPAGGSAVGEAAARAAVAPVLKAAGQDDAKVDAHQVTNGAVRVVNADPVVGGLPTYGWSTNVQVAADGSLLAGSGRLKEPVKGESLPVLSARRALDELNHTDVRAQARPSAGATPAAPAARVVSVTGAVFGLAAQDSGGTRVLSPAWLFEVREKPGAAPRTVVREAVDDRRTARRPAGTVAPGRQLSAYRTDPAGTRLSVTFWGGVCGTYTASADERAPGRVTVRITETPGSPGQVCVMTAVEVTKTVTLDRPLGGRTVVDGASGQAVPAG